MVLHEAIKGAWKDAQYTESAGGSLASDMRAWVQFRDHLLNPGAQWEPVT